STRVTTTLTSSARTLTSIRSGSTPVFKTCSKRNQTCGSEKKGSHRRTCPPADNSKNRPAGGSSAAKQQDPPGRAHSPTFRRAKESLHHVIYQRVDQEPFLVLGPESQGIRFLSHSWDSAASRRAAR